MPSYIYQIIYDHILKTKTRYKALLGLSLIFVFDFLLVVNLHQPESKYSFYLVWPSIIKLLNIFWNNRIKSDIRCIFVLEKIQFLLNFLTLFFLSELWVYIRSGETSQYLSIPIYCLGYMTRIVFVEIIFQSEIKHNMMMKSGDNK